MTKFTIPSGYLWCLVNGRVVWLTPEDVRAANYPPLTDCTQEPKT